MAYKLIQHKKIGTHTRFVEVEVEPAVMDGEEEVTPAVTEQFSWGWDVPLATVNRETKALLDAKYAVVEVEQPGIGTEL